MTDTLSPLVGEQLQLTLPFSSEPPKPRLLPQAVAIPQRNGDLSLNIYSPVNQNGSFEFDRVLKCGHVLKRTQKTKQWRKFYLVLRPNLLSIYKNSSEDRLHKLINLSDLTAVAYLKDPKGRWQYAFGLFSPSRNYHLQAQDENDARDWVELIRQEARIDEEEQMVLGSPIAPDNQYQSLGKAVRSSGDHEKRDQERFGSSSPEPVEASRLSTVLGQQGIPIPILPKPAFLDQGYSSNELGSFSDFSDSAHVRFSSQPLSSLPIPNLRVGSTTNVSATPVSGSLSKRPEPGRNSSQATAVTVTDQFDDRVIWQGYLLCLKSKGGVRQWKKLWVVLRTKNLAFYKNEEEYLVILLIPLSNIISAVEIDAVSKNKAHCMQILAEEKSFRFCAPSEEALTRWLGALKSQIARRKENINRKVTLK